MGCAPVWPSCRRSGCPSTSNPGRAHSYFGRASQEKCAGQREHSAPAEEKLLQQIKAQGIAESSRSPSVTSGQRRPLASALRWPAKGSRLLLEVELGRELYGALLVRWRATYRRDRTDC